MFTLKSLQEAKDQLFEKIEDSKVGSFVSAFADGAMYGIFVNGLVYTGLAIVAIVTGKRIGFISKK